jgi:hypothetical protein
MQGKLRNTHLKYHLATAALLNPDQLRRYGELRGYTAGAGSPDWMGEPGHPHMMESMRGQ